MRGLLRTNIPQDIPRYRPARNRAYLGPAFFDTRSLLTKHSLDCVLLFRTPHSSLDSAVASEPSDTVSAFTRHCLTSAPPLRSRRRLSLLSRILSQPHLRSTVSSTSNLETSYDISSHRHIHLVRGSLPAYRILHGGDMFAASLGRRHLSHRFAEPYASSRPCRSDPISSTIALELAVARANLSPHHLPVTDSVAKVTALAVSTITLQGFSRELLHHRHRHLAISARHSIPAQREDASVLSS